MKNNLNYFPYIPIHHNAKLKSSRNDLFYSLYSAQGTLNKFNFLASLLYLFLIKIVSVIFEFTIAAISFYSRLDTLDFSLRASFFIVTSILVNLIFYYPYANILIKRLKHIGFEEHKTTYFAIILILIFDFTSSIIPYDYTWIILYITPLILLSFDVTLENSSIYRA